MSWFETLDEEFDVDDEELVTSIDVVEWNCSESIRGLNINRDDHLLRPGTYKGKYNVTLALSAETEFTRQ